MKTAFRFLPHLLILGLLLGQTSCRKKEVDPSKGLSRTIQNIIPQAALDDLKAKGLVINEGSQPPNIEGVYIISPMRLLSPFGPTDTYAKGRIIMDYKYRFYEQVGDAVKFDYKNTANDTGTGQGAFLAGFGNKFSLFIETTGVSSGIENKAVRVISGEVSSNGIVNMQSALTLTYKKGDATDDVLIPINQARVWEDGDRLASKTSTYRMATANEQQHATDASLK